MKKHNVRVASLLLACLIALLMPAQAWAAAQNDEKEMGSGLEAEGAGSSEEDAKEDGGYVPAEEEEKEVLARGSDRAYYQRGQAIFGVGRKLNARAASPSVGVSGG